MLNVKRLSIIFVLGFCSGLPLNLLTSTLQAWFSHSGMSVMTTGMLSLIGLPFIFRAAIGPVLDRYSLLALGKRRSWIFCMQIIIIAGLNILALCKPSTSTQMIAGIALVLSFCSAILDASIDAHRTEYLPLKLHGLGVSIAVIGYRLALLISGGLALFIAKSFGFRLSYQIMSLFLLPGILVILISREPSLPTRKPTNFIRSFTLPFKNLLKQDGIVYLFLFIFFYKLGESFTTSTSGIVMPFLIQGVGFSLDTIAIVNKIIGVISIIAGGLISGLILLRYSLFKSLMLFGIIQALTNIFFVLLAIYGKNIYLFATAVVCDNFAAGMGTTALLALFMRLVDNRYTATQLSILISISTIPRVISGPFAGWIQSHIGWVGMYQLSIVLALLFIPFLIETRKRFSDLSVIRDYPEIDILTGVPPLNNP